MVQEITRYYCQECHSESDTEDEAEDCCPNTVIYKCGRCECEYSDESEAEDCCPNEVYDKFVFICEYCEIGYLKRPKAVDCEAKHKKYNDNDYQEYLFKQNREVLDEAAEHPEQKKLSNLGVVLMKHGINKAMRERKK